LIRRHAQGRRDQHQSHPPGRRTVVNDEKGTSTGGPDLRPRHQTTIVQIGSTPWVYYDYIFRQPEIAAGPSWPETATTSSMTTQRPWKLVQQLTNRRPLTWSICRRSARQLQNIQLTKRAGDPALVQRRGGRRSNNSVWTDWPSSTSTQDAQPATWNGYWQMGAIYMLTTIKAVTPAS